MSRYENRRLCLPPSNLAALLTAFGVGLVALSSGATTYAAEEPQKDAESLEASLARVREAVKQNPENPDACIKAAQALLEALESLSHDEVLGKSLWLAPADWRRHAEPPYRWSLLGEAGTPTEFAIDGTDPAELIEARELCETAVRLAPQNPDALAYLGVVLVNMGETADALGYLDRALTLAPHQAQFYNYRSKLFEEYEKKYAKSLNDLDEAIQLAPENVVYRVNRSVVLKNSGEIDRALAELDAVIQTTPAHFGARFRRGTMLYEAGRNAEAKTDLEECIRIRPDGESAYLANLGLGRVCFKLGEHERALKALKRAATIEPRQVTPHEIRAAVYHQLGRQDQALHEAELAIKKRPFHPFLHANRATILDELDRHDEAAEARRRAEWLTRWMEYRTKFNTAADAPQTWARGGRLALEGGEWEAAKTCFEKCADLVEPPVESIADVGLARVHLELGDYAEAVAAATRTIEQRDLLVEAAGGVLKPKHEGTFQQARRLRAEAYTALGQLDEAIADFEAVGAFGSEVAEAYSRRAEKRAAAGDAEAAAADRQRAAALDPLGSP